MIKLSGPKVPFPNIASRPQHGQCVQATHYTGAPCPQAVHGVCKFPHSVLHTHLNFTTHLLRAYDAPTTRSCHECCEQVLPSFLYHVVDYYTFKLLRTQCIVVYFPEVRSNGVTYYCLA